MLLTPHRRRAGFTLLELLVVMALITVLAAVSIGTYFRVRATAEKHATEVMVEKLASAMDQQVKAIIEEALAELRERRPVYLNCEPALNPIAQGDRRRV